MKRRGFAPLCTLLLLALPASLRPQSNLAPVPGEGPSASSVPAFAGELRKVEASLRATPHTVQGITALEQNLPGSWSVAASDGHYEVSAAPLRDLLAAAARDPSARAAKIEQARQWVAELESEADQYDSLSGTPDSQPRSQLDSILSQREFNYVHKTSATEWLQQKIGEWLERIIGSLFARIARHPIGVRAFFWILLIGAVAFLAVALFRFWLRRSGMEEWKPPRTFARLKTWQEWLRAAKEAASRGDFREAVHSAYWGGIARLEDLQLVPSDRTRTPREYVRFFSAQEHSSMLPSADPKASLAAITARLERTWYGRGQAGPSDFQDSLQELEALGCQLR
jgi:hypothetical protein